jgi:hypothetical protein
MGEGSLVRERGRHSKKGKVMVTERRKREREDLKETMSMELQRGKLLIGFSIPLFSIVYLLLKFWFKSVVNVLIELKIWLLFLFWNYNVKFEEKEFDYCCEVFVKCFLLWCFEIVIVGLCW